jgi:hypothetical protein
VHLDSSEPAPRPGARHPNNTPAPHRTAGTPHRRGPPATAAHIRNSSDSAAQSHTQPKSDDSGTRELHSATPHGHKAGRTKRRRPILNTVDHAANEPDHTTARNSTSFSMSSNAESPSFINQSSAPREKTSTNSLPRRSGKPEPPADATAANTSGQFSNNDSRRTPPTTSTATGRPANSNYARSPQPLIS